MRYGSNVGCPRSLHLFECLIDAILADDRNVFFSLQFSHRLQSPQPAGIRSCCDQQPSFFGMPSKDRKSTRLNSSHVSISYAVFCLKKKTIHIFASHESSL